MTFRTILALTLVGAPLGSAVAQTVPATRPPPAQSGEMVEPATVAGVMTQPLHRFPPAPKPAARGDFIGLSTANGRLAWDFIDLWFNQKKPEEAFRRYVSSTKYVNHAMGQKGEVQSFEEQVAIEAKITPPGAQFVVKQIVAQGELVVLHINAFATADSTGDQLVEILRFRGGKIIDHWDFHVPVKPNSTVFDRMDR